MLKGLSGSLGSVLLICLFVYLDASVANRPSWLWWLSLAVIIVFGIAAIVSAIILFLGVLADWEGSQPKTITRRFGASLR